MMRRYRGGRDIFDAVLFEKVGFAVNHAALGANTIATGSPGWRLTERGVGGYCTGGASFDIPDHGKIVAGDFTIRMVFKPISWPGAFTTLFDKGSGGLREVSIFVGTTGNVSGIDLGSFSAFSPATAMTAGGVYDFVLTRTSGSCQVYVDGRAVGSPITKASTVAQAHPLALGRNPSGGGSNGDLVVLLFQVWRRALPASEILSIAQKPYGMWDYEPPRSVFLPSGHPAMRRWGGVPGMRYTGRASW